MALVSRAEPIVVIGAAGFGRETLDVITAMIAAGADVEIAGVVDDAPSGADVARLAARGTAYLGTVAAYLEALETLDSGEVLDSGETLDPGGAPGPRAGGPASSPGRPSFVVGIGSPAVRRRLVERLEAAGLAPFTAIHPTASIGSLTTLGAGAVICAGVVISTGVTIGRHVHLNPRSILGHDAILGDYASVNPGAVVSGAVTIGPGVLVGAAATVLQLLDVGAGAVIGAGAVVTHSVPAGATAIGVPARWEP